MFEIRFDGPDRILLSGRFDAAQEEVAEAFLNAVEGSAVIDFTKLSYIASNGLGLLFATHKRLLDAGEALKLVNLNPHLREVYKLTGFDTIFEIE